MTTQPLALIIEDDERLAEIFSVALVNYGFATEIILDGAVAFARLTATEPAVVVLDLHLPNVPGQEILRQIRADERLAKTPVVVVTADLSAVQEVRDIADLILTKPFKVKMLQKAVERVISDHRFM